MPPIQTQTMPPIQPAQPMQPNGQLPPTGPNGMPMVQQVQVMPEQKKDIAGLIKTIVIIIVSLIAVTFIGLFIWMMVEKDTIESHLSEEINKAVAEARDEQSSKMEAEFLEREKFPYKTFSGPEDYGKVTFNYPKTWSVYIEQAATKGGDFKAYFNPEQVNAVSNDTLNALRLTILNKSYDEVTADYQREIDRSESGLTVEAINIGSDGATQANRYTGTIPGTEFSGYIVTFRIRDKTVVLQTDSVNFKDEFDKLLGTITYNK